LEGYRVISQDVGTIKAR